MTDHRPGWQECRQIHFMAQRTLSPLAASFLLDRRYPKRRAERLKPVIHFNQKIPLRPSYRADSNIAIHKVFPK
jgi:hypothetical protein